MGLVSGTGERCSRFTTDSSKLCPGHMRSLQEFDADTVLKCHKCMRVIWKDVKLLIPDIEATRQRNCEKAFYKSQGKKARFLQDLCWYNQADLNDDLEDPDVVLTKMADLVKAEWLMFRQARRLMSDEGGILTPDFIRMGSQTFGHMETLHRIATGAPTGPMKNLKGQPQQAPGQGRKAEDARARFLEAILGSGSGHPEDDILDQPQQPGVKVTRETKTTIEPAEAKPVRHILEVSPPSMDNPEADDPAPPDSTEGR